MTEDKPCKCGNKFIANRTYNLCLNCNFERLHGKTCFEAAIEKESVKPRKIYHLKRSPVRSTEATKEKREEVLRKDRELYLYIFNTKPNECEECRLNGIFNPLPDIFEDEEGNIVYISQFSHILSKGSSPEFRHNKLNINRLCHTHHDMWEFSEKEKMKIYAGNQVLIEKMRNS